MMNLSTKPPSLLLEVSVSRMSIELPPHPEPNMHNMFMTSYDHDYTGPIPHAKFTQESSGSGFVSNTPIFARPRTIEGTMVSAMHTLHTFKSTRLGPEEMAAAAALAAQPRIVATAHGRERGHLAPPAAPLTTTMKVTYTPKAIPGYTGPMQIWGAHAPTVLKPDFFHINSQPEVTKPAPPPQIYPSPGPHPGRTNLVTAAGGPGSYFQHSKLIGDRTLAYPSQLPRGLGDATDRDLIGTLHNKREMLSTLGGRRSSSCSLPKPIFETNPIAMSQAQQDTCRVGRRHENEGHFINSTYHSHYINQKNLPELSDPAKEKRGKCSAPLINLPSSNASCATTTNSRGELVEECPPSIHPSVWRRMKAVEESQRVDRCDPHAHKRRITIE